MKSKNIKKTRVEQPSKPPRDPNTIANTEKKIIPSTWEDFDPPYAAYEAMADLLQTHVILTTHLSIRTPAVAPSVAKITIN